MSFRFINTISMKIIFAIQAVCCRSFMNKKNFREYIWKVGNYEGKKKSVTRVWDTQIQPYTCPSSQNPPHGTSETLKNSTTDVTGGSCHVVQSALASVIYLNFSVFLPKSSHIDSWRTKILGIYANEQGKNGWSNPWR